MGQALYRTYRSQNLSEVIGQEHITQALANALKQGLINHAYLLTGPRGVGKTSIARILAYEINGLPYDEHGSHLDIIEIDAASNRRIDEIRDLRDKVHIAPTSAKYKVYIIDEVHMLTREAFNALLKTLEEPPAHVVFILATTEVHKLPETIISRTQRFTFRPIEQAKVVEHLRTIAKKEKISIEDDALRLIAAHGEGSFRDSISLLDQMRTLGRTVTASDIQSVLGIAPAALILQTLQAVEAHDAAAAVQLIGQLHAQGAAPAQVARQLGELLRQQYIAGEAALPHTAIIGLLTKLLDVPVSSDPRSYLEVILLDVALSGQPSVTQAAPSPSKPAAKPSKTVATSVAPAVTVAPAIKQSAAIPVVPNPVPAPATARKVEAPKPNRAPRAENDEADQTTTTTDDILDEAVWPQVLNTIKKKYNTLYSILSAAQPHFEPGKVILEVGFSFHQKRINELANKKIVADTIANVSGQTFRVACILGKGKPTGTGPALPPAEESEIIHTIAGTDPQAAAITSKPDDAQDDNDYYIAAAEKAATRPLDAVSDIFGGGELLDT